MVPKDYALIFFFLFATGHLLFSIHIYRHYNDNEKLRKIGNVFLSMRFMKHKKENLTVEILIWGALTLLSFLGMLSCLFNISF